MSDDIGDDGLLYALLAYFTTPDKGKNPILVNALKTLRDTQHDPDQHSEGWAQCAADDLGHVIKAVEDANNATYIPARPSA